jgi:hypothetical protein
MVIAAAEGQLDESTKGKAGESGERVKVPAGQ